MKKESDVPEMLIIVGVLIVASYPIMLKAKEYLSQKFSSISSFFNNILTFVKLNNSFAITIIGTGILVIYVIYRIIKSVKHRIETKKQETANLKHEAKGIEKILNKKLEFDYKGILAFIEQLENKIKLVNENKKLEIYEEELKDKLEKAKSFLECVEYESHINSLNLKGEELDIKVKELEQKKQQLEQDLSKPQEQKEYTSRQARQLNNEGFIDVHKGFFRYSSLSLDDIKYLKKKGYQEYYFTGITSDKKELYLIKPRPNESPQHFFLVFDIVEYLKKFTDKIRTYNTLKPDIIFEINYQEYAIEVETGKVLESDRNKLLAKVKNLNKNYGKNWFFVVTDKNICSQYYQLGETHDKRYVPQKILKIVRDIKTDLKKSASFFSNSEPLSTIKSSKKPVFASHLIGPSPNQSSKLNFQEVQKNGEKYQEN